MIFLKDKNLKLKIGARFYYFLQFFLQINTIL